MANTAHCHGDTVVLTTCLFGFCSHKPHLVSNEISEFAGGRYKAPFKTILEELATNQLSLEEYPSVLPMPDQGLAASVTASLRGSMRGKRGEAAGSVRKKAGASDRWARSSTASLSRSMGGNNFTGGRCIVFTVGGLSYSEIHIAREVMDQEFREIVVGSTAFVSPQEFLKDLEKLGQDGY